jgi:hypothetical protein
MESLLLAILQAGTSIGTLHTALPKHSGRRTARHQRVTAVPYFTQYQENELLLRILTTSSMVAAFSN